MIVEIANVSFYYDSIPALKDVSLKIEPSRITCIIGPNGAGKTTLLKVIASILRPSKGVVYIDGKDSRLYNAKEFAKLIAYEEPYISKALPMTVIDFLLTARYPHQNILQYFESKEDLVLIEDIARDLNILHLLDRRLDQVSSGELQRIIIAHALAKKPRILLLDEPSAFLDIRYRFEVLDYVKSYTIKNALTSIIALHDLHLASMYCDTVIVMNKGMIAAYGNAIDVFNNKVVEEVYGVKVEVIKICNGSVVIPIPNNCLNRIKTHMV